MIFAEASILLSSVRRHAGAKLACHAGVGAWIMLFYYGPQIWPFLPARPAPILSLDQWVPFQPSWALAYQSVFIVHTLALWLPRDLEAVKRYACSLAAVFASGAAVFWLYPTLSPRPAQSGSALQRWLISAVDGPRNAFPSLHAAMGLLAAVAVSRHLQDCRVSSWWRVVLVLWWLALLYSTLATRQHRLLDLLGGICLGLISIALSPTIVHSLRRHVRSPAPPGPSSLC